jgi:hypothetical protein
MRCAAEYRLTPQRLQELNDKCIHEQQELEQEERREELRERQMAREYKQEELEMQMQMELEQPREWLEEYKNGVHRGTHTHTTYFKPKQEVYEGYRMADESPDVATSLEHGTWLNANAVPLAYKHQLWEHGMLPPDLEHTLVANPGYDNEANVHRFVHATHHGVEPHINNTVPFEHEHTSLWHKMQAVDEE